MKSELSFTIGLGHWCAANSTASQLLPHCPEASRLLQGAAATNCPQTFPWQVLAKLHNWNQSQWDFFFQARCLPEAEIFKVLVEMFTSEMGMKKKIILLILLKTYSGLPGCRAALQHHRGVVSAAFSVSTSTRFNQSTSYTSAERFQVTPSQLASNCRVKRGEKGS